MVNNFSEFCEELLQSGFSMAGGNARGIYAIIPFDWRSVPPQSPIVWHTDDPETDPWQWRMRVLKERDDIAYSKVFFGTGGYITKEWYPFFLAVRRQGLVFDEWYDEGKASQLEKAIYETVLLSFEKVSADEGYFHKLCNVPSAIVCQAFAGLCEEPDSPRLFSKRNQMEMVI